MERYTEEVNESTWNGKKRTGVLVGRFLLSLLLSLGI